MSSLVTLDEVKARIDWTLDEGEERLTQGALDDLSEDARFYSGQEWEIAADAPPRVKSLILRATVRFLRNPEGASQSRAGDETLAWDNRRNEKAGSAYFVDDEIAELQQVNSGLKPGFGTFGTYAWTQGGGPRDLTIGTVPPHGDPLPWIAKEDEVWW